MTFEDELLALERRVLEGAGGDFFAAVAALRRMLAMEAPGIEAAILKLAVPQLQAAAVSGVGEAWSLGGGRALDSAMLGGLDANAIGDASELRVKTGPPKRLSDPLDGLDGLLGDAKAKASALLRSGVGADAALAPIFNAATTARLRVTTQINAASNQAALEVGDATSSPMVWEAERDACVYCLALAGEVVETPGQTFPRADLYADPPPSQWTVERPPLHGHCRCRLAILVEPSYADALKREAQRSILRGTSLSSESNAVRIRAASRLLERDPIAPKSVKEYARKAVKAGTFPKGREVPTGDPRLVITRAGGEPPKPPKPPRAPRVDPAVKRAMAGREVDVRGGARPAYDPKNPLAYYGNTLTMHDTSAAALDNAAQLAKFPEGAHHFLREHYAESPEGGFYFGDGDITGLDSNDNLKGVQPRGWTDGSTFEQVAGVYSPAKRTCSCGSLAHGSSNLAAHEGGHALDHAISTQKVFGLAVNPSLAPRWRNPMIELTEATTVAPYYSPTGNPRGWESESWAEAWAAYVSNREKSDQTVTREILKTLGVFDAARNRPKVRAIGAKFTAYFREVETALGQMASKRPTP